MLLAQGRFWRASVARNSGVVVLELRKAALPVDLQELRDLRVEASLAGVPDEWTEGVSP